MKQELKVGDVIIAKKYGEFVREYIIDRVTKTLAISGDKKFKKEIDRGVVREHPRPQGVFKIAKSWDYHLKNN